MKDVRMKAKGLGLKTGRATKADLIHAIQREEGNFPCFGTAVDYCDQEMCCFRADCFYS